MDRQVDLSEKVLLLVLDGATNIILGPMMNRGDLPTFNMIKNHGTMGSLISPIPVMSPPAWSSMATGKNPGKHGVYDFERPVPNSYETRAHSSMSIRGKTMWDLSAQGGKQAILVNVPWTYPPYKINGVMVSGFPSSVNEMVTYPPQTGKLLREKVKEYRIDVSRLIGMDEEALLDEIYRVTRARSELVRLLMDDFQWDLFIAAFTCLDRIQHVFWRYMDENHPAYVAERAQIYGRVIEEYYRSLDQIIGRVLTKIDKSVTMFIVSDHGFEPLYKHVGINNWLAENGLLAVPLSQRLHVTKDVLYNLMSRLRLRRVVEAIPHSMRDLVPAGIDFKNTKAYAQTFAGIRINMKGREPHGTVPPGKEYDGLVERLMNSLRELEDPENGEKIVEYVYTKEDLYHGEFLSQAPDILLLCKEGYEPKAWTRNGSVVEPTIVGEVGKTIRSGCHQSSRSREGILFAIGKNIRRSHMIDGVDMTDVAPTILHILGIPLPIDMDGKVRHDLFKPDSEPAKREVEYKKPQEWRFEEEAYTSEEVEVIKRRLEGLGYM